MVTTVTELNWQVSFHLHISNARLSKCTRFMMNVIKIKITEFCAAALTKIRNVEFF